MRLETEALILDQVKTNLVAENKLKNRKDRKKPKRKKERASSRKAPPEGRGPIIEKRANSSRQS